MGQLGDGTTTKRLRPVTVTGLSGVVDVVGGRDMSYARLADGTVRSWGGGANGELGNGTLTARQTRPVTVTGLTGVVALAAGRNHGLALRSDGTVMAWGLNSSGQLGNGTKTSRSTPVQVSGIAGAIAVAAGADHSVALLADGRVFAWGEAGRGQLGQRQYDGPHHARPGDRPAGDRRPRLRTRPRPRHHRHRDDVGVGSERLRPAGRRHDHAAYPADPGARRLGRRRGGRRPRLHRAPPTTPPDREASSVSPCRSGSSRCRRRSSRR